MQGFPPQARSSGSAGLTHLAGSNRRPSASPDIAGQIPVEVGARSATVNSKVHEYENNISMSRMHSGVLPHANHSPFSQASVRRTSLMNSDFGSPKQENEVQSGYYLPPPGYHGSFEQSYSTNDPKYQQGKRMPHFSKESSPISVTPRNPQIPVAYGGHGEYRGQSSFSPLGDVKISPGFDWLGNAMGPILSHRDWTIPQAKQILSHWATLSTLLGSVQATLLTFYNKDTRATDMSSTPYRFVVAVSCSALFLEVYGALLAAGTIVASITLQTRSQNAVCKSIGQIDQHRGSDQMSLPSVFFDQNKDTGPSRIPAQTCLSPLATAVLDRLTVLCGFIISLGACLELLGLATYGAHALGSSVAIAMLLTLLSAIIATLLAALFGVLAGKSARKTVNNSHSLPRQDSRNEFSSKCYQETSGGTHLKCGDQGPRLHSHTTVEPDEVALLRQGD